MRNHVRVPRLASLRPYGVAFLALFVAAIVVRVQEVRNGIGTPILVFFFAIFVTAWYGGLWPGLFLTGLILFLTSLSAEFTPERAVRFVLFLTCGATISLLLEALHAARRKIENNARELNRSQGQLRQLMESITDYAIFTTDPEGKVTSWSPGAEKLLGYSEPEVIGRLVAHFLGAGWPSGVGEGWTPGTGFDNCGRDMWCLRRDGSRFCASASTTPLPRDGSAGSTWVLRDVTERNRTEAELRLAKESAESASQTKDQFLATLSHELRTPLTPALVSVSAMMDDPETPGTLRPSLEVIHRNIMLEARLIDDLLDVTRISQGKLRLNREMANAHDLIERAVEICRDEIAGSGLELEFALRADDHHVESDPARFQQIVWNLIKNAVKFTPRRGRIVVRTYNQETSQGHTAPRRLVVEVSDTGIGIDPLTLDTIFNAFEQGSSGHAKQLGGLGLGLSISRSLAHALGGSLVASSPGKDQGATFRLELPATRIATSASALLKIREPSAAVESLHILLVEDNEDTLRVMTRLLRRRGYRVSTASCLAAALQAAQEPFDLLVSDIGLPDGSGLELMRHLRNQRAVPGIALSGFGMEEDLKKSREAGFTIHLTKPVDFPALEAAIRRTLAAAG